jgi:hypothetical protein
MYPAALGFLLQSVAAGMPAGHSLCIGCKQGGWRIAEPCAADSRPDCCAERAPRAAQAPATLPLLEPERSCGCFDVPLVTGVSATATAACTDLVLVLAKLCVPAAASDLENAPATAVAPGGLRSPPALAAPLSRHTVLLV